MPEVNGGLLRSEVERVAGLPVGSGEGFREREWFYCAQHV